MTTPAMLCLALLLDAALGEPRWLWDRCPHPAVLMGRAVAWLERRLNTGTDPLSKGIIAVAILVIGAGALGWVLSLAGPILTVPLVAVLLAHRSLVDHVAAVARGLRRSLPAGRRAVAMIVSRDTSEMDGAAVARSAIESAAENLSDGVIAPAFWFLVGGLPALMIYKAVNTADSMIGYRTARYERFGKAAARLDDLLNLIPARLTALLLSIDISGGTPWRQIIADARLHRSPNAGWPEAAVAHRLDIALAGPRSYDGTLRNYPFVNANGRRDLRPSDIDDTIALLWCAWAFLLVLTFALTIMT